MELHDGLQWPLAGPDESSSIGMLQAIRRIARCTNAEESPDRVLRSFVDTISEQTRWQVCWVSAIDISRQSLFVVARSDRVDYTTEGRKATWSLQGSPASAAMRADEPIVIPDAQASTEFPDYQSDAIARGYRSGVVMALNGQTDDMGRPLVLYLQSRAMVNPTPEHLVALRHIVDIGATALRNSLRLARQTAAASAARRAAEAADAVIDAVLEGLPDHTIYDLVERSFAGSFAVIGPSAAPLYTGHSPLPDSLSDDGWKAVLHSSLPLIVEQSAHAAGSTSFEPARVRIGEAPVGIDADVVQIGAGERTIGTIVTVPAADHSAGPDSSAIALRVVRSAIATVMLRGYLEYRAGSDLRSDLLTRLFTGEWTRREEILARAGHVGLPVDRSVALVAIESAADSTALTSDQKLRVFSTEIASWEGALIVRAGDGLALMVPLPEGREKRLAGWLHSLKTFLEAQIGGDVLMSFGGRCDRLEDYPRAWRHCEVGIEVARKLRRSDLVFPDDFGVHRLLLAAIDAPGLQDFIHGSIGEILQYDSEHGTDLFETLEQFALAGGRYQETARALHIHVSTLRYRLGRIEALYGRPLDTETRFEAALAARLYRFIEGQH